MRPHLLFIYGLFNSSAYFDAFRAHAASRGFDTSAPPWPHLDRPAAELRAAPPPGLARVGLPELVDHYTAIVEQLDRPTVLIGHSLGGLVVQLLLDRGIGAAGVAVASAPVRGVPLSPAAFQTNLPVLARLWARLHVPNRGTFARNFANTLPPERLDTDYDKHMVPAPGKPFRELVSAPLHRRTAVTPGPHSRPLLFVGGERDRPFPPSAVKALHHWYQRRGAPADLLIFPNLSHWLMTEPGYQHVADAILDWIERNPVPTPESARPTPLTR